jgi:predicted Zn-dependent protease
VIFQRILLLLTLMVTAVACTPQNNLPQTAAAGAAGTRPPPLPEEVSKRVGATYDEPRMQALVDRVGRRLVTQAGIDGRFGFYVLDQPEPNAHALGSNYIFVTRGLLVLLDDEAELAAAMGHEIGHVILRHAAQRSRERQAASEDARKAAATSGSTEVGRSVARDRLLELRRYSRDQEIEADRAGLGYIVKAGYRGSAMAGVIEKLRRAAVLDRQALGPAFASDGPVNALSTHPEPDVRLAALATQELAQAPGESNSAGFLATIDGLSVDERPEEGFVRGPVFAHPVMKIAFRAPADFVLLNEKEAVIGVGRDRSMMSFTCSNDAVPGRLDDWMRNKINPTPTDIQATTIDGAEAAIGAKPRGADTGLAQIRYVMLRKGAELCSFTLIGDGPDRERRIEELVSSARSFHFLSDAEAAALRPRHLHVIPRATSSAEMLARQMPYADLKLERLLTLNGVDDAAAFARSTDVKIVEP